MSGNNPNLRAAFSWAQAGKNPTWKTGKGGGWRDFVRELVPLLADEVVISSQVRVMKEVKNSDFMLI